MCMDKEANLELLPEYTKLCSKKYLENKCMHGREEKSKPGKSDKSNSPLEHLEHQNLWTNWNPPNT